MPPKIKPVTEDKIKHTIEAWIKKGSDLNGQSSLVLRMELPLSGEIPQEFKKAYQALSKLYKSSNVLDLTALLRHADSWV